MLPLTPAGSGAFRMLAQLADPLASLAEVQGVQPISCSEPSMMADPEPKVPSVLPSKTMRSVAVPNGKR